MGVRMNASSISNGAGSSSAVTAKAGGKENVAVLKKALDTEKSEAEGTMKMLDASSSVTGGGSKPGVGVMLDVTA